ncbi:uncharacterized mitochondrial protein AtMg00810-like [Lathyrus oleraceus]|uniref:uncharacterized mitochondrial protein AtMg00810-like n=1 Tax=Pisum sativum TaxID=3888 RepID=UPI0021CDFFDB|nr:uncharacterized mitochondrial protein AtMg00810-like [Pisum sativum]
MGKMNYFLGLQIKQLKDGIFINQLKYCKELLKIFEMDGCKAMSTPMGSGTYVDQDELGCKTDRKNTSGTCHILGNALVSWSCKKQACVALSTAEAEYIAAGSCRAQNLWLKQQLSDYGIDLGCIPLRCDNTSAINITKNPVMHSRTKHIDIRHHFLRDHVLKGDVEVTFVDTHNQLADIFTKPLAKEPFYKIQRELGILDEGDI